MYIFTTCGLANLHLDSCKVKASRCPPTSRRSSENFGKNWTSQTANRFLFAIWLERGGLPTILTKVAFKREPHRLQVIEKMVRPERIELPTSWFVAKHSIQLSYGRIVEKLGL